MNTVASLKGCGRANSVSISGRKQYDDFFLRVFLYSTSVPTSSGLFFDDLKLGETGQFFIPGKADVGRKRPLIDDAKIL